MTEAKEQLLSSGKSLLYAVTQAYCKSESSPEVISHWHWISALFHICCLDSSSSLPISSVFMM